MRPNMPPQIGLLVALFVVAIATVLFGTTLTQSPALAQDGAQANNALVTTEDESLSLDGFDDLVIGIHSAETFFLNEVAVFSATVNITDTSKLSFSWQFGDGQSAEGQLVEHVYTATGNYRVRLFVRSDGNQKDTEKRVQVGIRPTPVEVAPKGLEIVIVNADPDDLEAQAPVNFLATVKEGSNLKYTWDFGDGSPKVSGSFVTHAFDQPSFSQPNSRYQVSVVAENSKGVEDAARPVLIKNAPPENLGFMFSPNPATLESSVTFTATTSRGTNLTYEWEFSDGSGGIRDIILENGRVVIHPFDLPGRYEVNVKAWNDRGEEEYSATMAVNAAPPYDLEIITNSPQSIGELVVVVIFVKSQAPVTLLVKWGDGQSDTVSLAPQPSTQIQYQHRITHIYNQSRKFPMMVTAFNDFGFVEGSAVINIDTDAVPDKGDPEIEYREPVFPDQETRFRVKNNNRSLTCTWTFSGSPSVNGDTVVHVFSHTGGQTVTLVCRDDARVAQMSSEFVLNVQNGTFLPVVNNINDPVNDGGPRQPVGTATPVVTATPVDTPVPSDTATPVPQATATHTPIPPTPIPPTVTETATFVPTMPPAAPTATATATFVPTMPPP